MGNETIIAYDKRTDDLLFEFLTAAFNAGVVNAEESFRLNQFRQKFTVQISSPNTDARELCDGEPEGVLVPDEGRPGELWYERCTICGAEADYLLERPHERANGQRRYSSDFSMPDAALQAFCEEIQLFD